MLRISSIDSNNKCNYIDPKSDEHKVLEKIVDFAVEEQIRRFGLNKSIYMLTVGRFLLQLNSRLTTYLAFESGVLLIALLTFNTMSLFHATMITMVFQSFLLSEKLSREFAILVYLPFRSLFIFKIKKETEDAFVEFMKNLFTTVNLRLNKFSSQDNKLVISDDDFLMFIKDRLANQIAEIRSPISRLKIFKYCFSKDFM